MLYAVNTKFFPLVLQPGGCAHYEWVNDPQLHTTFEIALSVDANAFWEIVSLPSTQCPDAVVQPLLKMQIQKDLTILSVPDIVPGPKLFTLTNTGNAPIAAVVCMQQTRKNLVEALGSIFASGSHR